MPVVFIVRLASTSYRPRPRMGSPALEEVFFGSFKQRTATENGLFASIVCDYAVFLWCIVAERDNIR